MSQYPPPNPQGFGLAGHGSHGQPMAPKPQMPGHVNPYAPPTAPTGYYAPLGQSSAIPDGVWRQGKLLVMHKRAQLPPICVKSNQPSSQWLKRNLAWHEPWIAITILAGLLVYVILALILTKRATIYIGLTEEWIARRKSRLLVSWLAGLGCIAMIPLAIAIAAATENEGWLLLLLPAVIGGIIVLVLAQSLVGLVSPQRITDDYVWLKGVNRDFLDRLPVFPYRV